MGDRVRRAACGIALLVSFPLSAQTIPLRGSPPNNSSGFFDPTLPDPSGWGLHVLTVVHAPDSTIWVGTYGEGIFVLRRGVVQNIRASSDTAAHSISWDFVHAFAFGPRGEIWYGTVGNGWGVSIDGGKTWKNWEFAQLGPEWQYVAPDGIVTHGDTTYIATADGIKLTWDDGQTWRVITDSIGTTTAKDAVWGLIGNQYVHTLHVWDSGGRSKIRIGTLKGWETSIDGGRTWKKDPPRVVFVDAVGTYPDYTVPLAGTISKPQHTWFKRPISLKDQPYIDQTYRFGSTMGGNFQAHQGVEFNNPDGTPVHAIGDGVVVHSGPAERGALTVAIKHDRRLTADGKQLFVYSVYYHNSKLLAQVGQRVKAGDVIALVGNTGRATNDHLHLEVHASPFDSTRLIVDPDVRYPPYNTNPELWIEPLPGTGIIAGQVWDSAGNPVLQARIHGLVKPEPRETPFSYIETYGPKNHSDPAYHEDFGISDVPPGTYVLGVEIDGKRVFRQVKVEAGKLTWVEFKP